MTKEKLCVFCEHWKFSGGAPTYSDLTIGDPSEMKCDHGYIQPAALHYASESEFRRLILKANKCLGYTPVVSK